MYYYCAPHRVGEVLQAVRDEELLEVPADVLATEEDTISRYIEVYVAPASEPPMWRGTRAASRKLLFIVLFMFVIICCSF